MTKATKNLIAKAKTGDVEAMRELGRRSRFGDGVKQNIKNAIYCYRKASELDDIESQFNLGYMYLTGEGVDINKEKAYHWLQRAAEQGHANSKCLLLNNNYNLKQSKDSTKGEPLERDKVIKKFEENINDFNNGSLDAMLMLSGIISFVNTVWNNESKWKRDEIIQNWMDLLDIE